MDPDRLWAKSKRFDERELPSMLLPQHLADVCQAAARMLDSTGGDQLLALGLPPGQYLDRFRRCVRLAAVVHDIGKANDHFQGMICGERNILQHPQGLRHEWVSVLLLREKLRDWLLPAVDGNETDMAPVEWAIGGHHPAYGRESPPRRNDPQGAGDQLIALTAHPGFSQCLRVLKDRLPVGAPPEFRESWRLALVGPEIIFAHIQKWFEDSRLVWEGLTDNDKRLAAAVKVALIAADVAGSALPRHLTDETKRASWITDALANTPQPGELAGIVSKRLDGGSLRAFQAGVAKSQATITFVKAGCGSGKTLAAYHWAATKHPTRRLYFCYPTTGTATEGFRDYLYTTDMDSNYRLFHGRADIDMELIVKGDDTSIESTQ